MTCRAVLICGSARTLAQAAARALIHPARHVALQVDGAGAPVAAPCAGRRAPAGTLALLPGVLGGDRPSRVLVRRALRTLGALDGVIICTAAPGVRGAPSLAAWHAAIDAHLRTPFFLAKHAAAILEQAGGGRIVLATVAPADHRTVLGHVVHESVRCLADALSRAVPREVGVAAVMAPRAATARERADLARAIALMLDAEVPPRGSVLLLSPRGPR